MLGPLPGLGADALVRFELDEGQVVEISPASAALLGHDLVLIVVIAAAVSQDPLIRCLWLINVIKQLMINVDFLTLG